VGCGSSSSSAGLGKRELASTRSPRKTKTDDGDRNGIALLSQAKPLADSANAAADTIGATACASSA
jgi:hypothetical protein